MLCGHVNVHIRFGEWFLADRAYTNVPLTVDFMDGKIKHRNFLFATEISKKKANITNWSMTFLKEWLSHGHPSYRSSSLLTFGFYACLFTQDLMEPRLASSHYVGKTWIFLSLPPRWDYRCRSPCPTCFWDRFSHWNTDVLKFVAIFLP